MDGKMEQQYGQRISSLEKEVHGMNASISEVRSDGAATRNRVDRMADALDRFMEKESQPWITPGAVAMAMGTLFAVALTFAFGIAEYIAIRDAPLQQALQGQANTIAAVVAGQDEFLRTIEEFRTETHYEVAKAHAHRESADKYMAHKQAQFLRIQDDLDELMNRITELEKGEARDRTALRALGDYVSEHVKKIQGHTE